MRVPVACRGALRAMQIKGHYIPFTKAVKGGAGEPYDGFFFFPCAFLTLVLIGFLSVIQLLASRYRRALPT